MKLLFKFNLIFVAVFALGLLATGLVARDFLQRNAREQVLQQARLLMETAAAMRSYTANEIRPLLEKTHKHDAFYPQSVPAFSANKLFSKLHEKFPDYNYREATLNPTNLSDRAVDWESDVIGKFRNNASALEFSAERESPTGRSLFVAKPIKSVQACLTCHSTPEVAPPAMVKSYGRDNGFGWKLDEIVAAQIVSVPMTVPQKIAEDAFLTLMEWLVGIAVASVVLLNVTLIFSVIRPVKRMSVAADEISSGNMNVPELEVRGKDEVGVLAESFNRMHRSLAKAMEIIERS